MPPKRPPSTSGVVLKAKKRRRIKGLLERVSETPLDVLLEIFSRLEPRDLLHLCRTNKFLRSVLLDRNSLDVWRRARQSLEDLPDLPVDLSEPRYASLLFDKYCQFCLRTTSLVQWVLRTRCCKDCVQNTEIFSPTLDRQSMRMSWIIPFVRCDDTTYYYVPSVVLLNEEVKDVLNDETNFHDWCHKKNSSFGAIRTHGEACDTWLAQRLNERKRELRKIRRDRLQDVIERLKALGWEDLIYRVPWRKIAAHKLVAQSRPLTERAWRNMEPVMVEFMNVLQVKNKKNDAAMYDFGDCEGRSVVYESWTLDGERNQFGPFDCQTGKYANTWLTDFSLGIAFEQYDT
ncbi:uncharacterized protein EV420DRAFT_1559499 [Desarmillaria tabescens]|uniref:F-box domain-containing protein n=1 Tax=Armillaria tabescens TaxID=1929756 RepID=A0AA39K2J6_ARMTA|nr:uncharacterized protein EV420DRAFT_1559499 [Desarmillaria tabescens]KAK0451974.1 hypothetical protein EV420DRAFT_1559499 [Desarmillaria tabescens]